jgi:alpha/beta superfamily hydrolase
LEANLIFNKGNIMKLLTLLLLMIGTVNAQITPDYAKETRWAEQVEDGLMDGDSVWLTASDHEFMAIYTPSETDTKRTAVVVHGLGVHPDWVQVIQPLRVALTSQGFNTLSIQMPVLENDAHSGEYKQVLGHADLRIKAAVEYLEKEGLVSDVLVAHSLGSVMSTHYLANFVHPFKRFVGIGMGPATAEYLKKIDIPVFDLYGDEDLEAVLTSVKDRANASKNNSNYSQMKVSADHFFNDKDSLLIESVGTWLK